MTATLAAAEQRLVLHNMSWETYERLLADLGESAGTRVAFCDGDLEIMVASAGHEHPHRHLSVLIDQIAEGTGKDIWPLGSTTFKRQDLAKGVEPDSCFYFKNAGAVRGKGEIDLLIDPAPELVLEVDITRSSLNRFGIFAALGVSEIWRYDGARVGMYVLEMGQYSEVPASAVLPPLTARQATYFLEQVNRQTRSEWLRGIREWLRAAR